MTLCKEQLVRGRFAGRPCVPDSDLKRDALIHAKWERVGMDEGSVKLPPQNFCGKPLASRMIVANRELPMRYEEIVQ